MTDTVQLTSSQQMAIREIDRNLQIIACAGSGKTEVITRRIAYILERRPDIAPKNIVAFTFTEKAAESMQSRIQSAVGSEQNLDGMYVGTIHSFCYRLLQEATDEFADIKVLDTVRTHHFIRRYGKECGLQELGLTGGTHDIQLFQNCIEKMIDAYSGHSGWPLEQQSAFDHYRQCLYSHGYIDFSFLLFEALEQIKTNKKVKERLKDIRYLVVDEYQDVDDLQEKLIHEIADAGANICVVGDDDQTIYQFRGSNAENMISFAGRYQNVRQVRLEENFRCVPGIVDVADHVIQQNQHRLDKKMVSKVKISSCQNDVFAKQYTDQTEQYQAIGRKIQELHPGVPYREIAILVRKGKYIQPIAEELQKMGIPVETDSADHFFEGIYFRGLLETVRYLSEGDKAELLYAWTKLFFDRKKVSAGERYLRKFTTGGKTPPLQDILQKFCEKIGFLEGECEARKNVLEGIQLILSDYEEIYGDWQLSARVKGVLRFLDEQASSEYKYHSFEPKDPDTDAVQIMTVHKSKGLEFQAVFLPEMEEGEFPIRKMGGKQYWHVLGGDFELNKSKYQSDLEDERKLFYVAVTRAKHYLFLSYELSTKKLSCFVKEATESPCLTVDPEDLLDPREKEAELRQMAAAARKALYNHYGTAIHCNPAALGDVGRVKGMSDSKAIAEAKKLGLK